MNNSSSDRGDGLGYMPSIPFPYFCWTFWKWQKVRCQCGKAFVSKDLGFTPPEYAVHWVLTHLDEEEKA